MGTQTSMEQVATVDHKKCVSESAMEMFNVACGVELKDIENETNLNSDGVLIAIISIIGDVEWSIFLGLPKVTAEAVAEKFAGFAIPFDSEDMGDAVGELANILAGLVKSKLDSSGIKADISLPSVMRAENMEVLIQRESSTCKACFDSEIGKLWTGVVTSNSPGFVA